jgi:hypothetical protein
MCINYYAETEEDDEVLLLAFLMSNYKSISDRFLTALSFIFSNKQPKQSIFDSIMLKQSDMDKLIGILNLYSNRDVKTEPYFCVEYQNYLLSFFVEDIEDGAKIFTSFMSFKKMWFLKRVLVGIGYVFGYKDGCDGLLNVQLSKTEAENLRCLAKKYKQ